MSLELRPCALLLATVLACGAGQGAAESLPPPIPIEALFQDPMIGAAAISPDGHHLASVASKGETQYLVIWDLESNQKKPIRRFSKDARWRGQRVEQHVYWVGWASDERVLIALQYRIAHMAEAAIGFHLYAVDRDGRNEKRFFEGFSDFQAPTRMDADPEHILVRIGGALYRVNLKTGGRKLYQQARTGIDRWILDHRDRVRLGIGVLGLRYSVQRLGAAKTLEPLREGRLYFEPDFVPLGFGADDKTLYVASNHESDTSALYEFDLETNQFGRKLFGHPDFDVYGSLVISQQRDALLAVPYFEDTLHYHFTDAEFARQMGMLERALPGRTSWVSDWNREENRWIVEAAGDLYPPVTYLYDPAKRQLLKLFDSHPELATQPLSPSRPVSFQARDGLSLRGYLTLPRGYPETKLPLVVIPHGGPHARDQLGWNPEVQFLASRGYAVLRVNFRGSQGFGRRFRFAGYKQWGLAMQDDLSDAVRELIQQGTADPDRIAIYGASYGGYAALMGVIREPGLFRCGASFAAVTDLPDLLQGMASYDTLEQLNTLLIGDPTSDGELLRSVSPRHNAARIQAPVLIAYGEKDGVVPPRQARLLTEALEHAGRPYEELYFPAEAHGLVAAASRLRFYGALEAFLAKHTQPRSRPPSAADTAAADTAPVQSP